MVTGCMQLHDWLPTHKSQESVRKLRTLVLHILITSLICVKQQVFEPLLRILITHIEKPCFVHFKYPLDMCKTRGCKLVCTNP